MTGLQGSTSGFLRISVLCLILPVLVLSQSLTQPWLNYSHNPQHTALSAVQSQALNRIKWQTLVDLAPRYSGNELLIHYGSPLVTAGNSVIVPVKTGAVDGFRVDVRNGADGSLKYSLSTDYSLPPHNWTPSFGPVLTVRNRLYWAGAGGTVYYRDQPDSTTGPSGQIAFYGNATYASGSAVFNNNVRISTPLIADRYGSVFFGYVVLGSNPANLSSGIARIDYTGAGSFVTAVAAAGGDNAITEVAMNCAPTLSNDQRTLYFAVSSGSAGYLAAVSATTLAPAGHVRLRDPRTGSDAQISDDGTATPMVGPDNDVFYGVLENPLGTHNYRGWLLHFDSTLTQIKTPGSFGWDDTPSVVPSKLVPSYQGSSLYLVLTKYNNYAGVGGDGVNRVAILDPDAGQSDSISGITVMKEVITVAGPTPDLEDRPSFPNAVKEWCINSAAVDPFSKSALVNNEDGVLYRWDFTANALTQSIVLTPGLGEAYTPTLIGVDGTVYAINNATLFAVGQ
jgi:hypothetical protein